MVRLGGHIRDFRATFQHAHELVRCVPKAEVVNNSLCEATRGQVNDVM